MTRLLIATGPLLFTLATFALLALLGVLLGLITHVYTCNFTRSGESLTGSISNTGDGEDNHSQAWLSAPTSLQFAIAFAFAKVRSVYIVSTQDATLDTNATDATGGDAITLKANKPLQWYVGCGQANPFTHNVTTCYLTSAAVTGQIDIRILMDSTL